MYKKRVTLKDIAQKAGVSSTVVSVVLNGREDIQIAPDTRERVHSAAKELGYVYTKPRRESSRPLISFVHSESYDQHIGTSFFVTLASRLRSLCEQEGYGVQEIECSVSAPLPSYQTVLSSRARMIVSFNQTFTELCLSQGHDVPLFQVQGERRGADRCSLYLVDDRQVGELAALRLLDQGRRYCAMIFPPLKGRCEQERFQTFRRTFESRKAGTVHIEMDSSAHKEIEAWFRKGKGEGFDSFFFFSDAMALPALRGLQTGGRRVPEDASVIGTDNLYWGQYTSPSLTTLNLHEELFAGRIFRDIRSFIQDGSFYPGETVIRPELLVRESG
ncbi:MAG: LacI family DNA-binding transcriptional regulator [Spirochaetales bacterium]|nr:LacI family DNA-binding transcriptional regulator [Spirochaetales bacterium]